MTQVESVLSVNEKEICTEPFIKNREYMKKVIYALILPLVVVIGLVFASREGKSETSTKSLPQPLSEAEKKAALKQWEATPDGIQYKKWQASPAGQKVFADIATISEYIRDYANMEGVVTALTLPEGARLGFGLMVSIQGEAYILAFGPEKDGKRLSDSSNEFKDLQRLQVGDKVIVRSHNVSHAPKYAYPIISGDEVERDGKLIFKRAPRKDGC